MEVLSQLLSHGADVSALDVSGCTALHQVLSMSIPLQVQQGFVVFISSNFGWGTCLKIKNAIQDQAYHDKAQDQAFHRCCMEHTPAVPQGAWQV